MTISLTSRPDLFVVQPGSDGVDLTFDVCCRQTGLVIAAFHSWEAAAEAESSARQFANALDAFYRAGGLLHLNGFLDAYSRHRDCCASRLVGLLVSERRGAPKQPLAVPPDPEGMNDQRSQWAEVAVRTFQRVTGADDDDALGDLLTDLMHWSDRNGLDFRAAFDRALNHYAAETTLDEDDL